MDDMVAQGFGAIVIIYGGLIVIAFGVVVFITKFWSALVSGDTGFILMWCEIILVLVSLYAGCGLLLRRYGII
jgi:amino acid permease